jgi:hypothetical protein
MPRMPECEFLSQTKSPDTNNGIAVWNCSQFDITWESFIDSSQASVLQIMDNSYGQNTNLFKECFTCPHNQRRG